MWAGHVLDGIQSFDESTWEIYKSRTMLSDFNVYAEVWCYFEWQVLETIVKVVRQLLTVYIVLCVEVIANQLHLITCSYIG